MNSFFLDEGFGTLDPELLDAVVTALEKLHLDNLTVGVISHVPELRAGCRAGWSSSLQNRGAVEAV